MSSSSAESLLSEHEEQSVGLLSDMEARSEHQKAKQYGYLHTFSFSIGISLLIAVFTWVLHYRGGFAWQSNPSKQFNWHPLLMVLGMVFLYSQSILVYRTFRNAPKRRLKIIHACMHCFTFIVVVIGLKAVFDSHNLAKPPMANLYTLHSWIGLSTVIIFSLQLVIGFITFLFPGLATTIRQAFLPVHTAVGIAGFVLAIVTTMTGLTEKAIWTLNDDYSKFVSEGIMFNFMGLLTLFYGVMVLYMVYETTYKRTPLPEDEIALTDAE